jgi:transcription elongation GreA/GreB family factor
MLDLQAIREQVSRLQKQYEATKKTSLEMDSRNETRYDTQREDFAREAEMIERSIISLESLIAELEKTRVAPDAPVVSVGHTVTLEIDGDPPERFLVVNQVGGVAVGDVVTLSVDSPIGAAILGKRAGATATALVNKSRLLPVRIVSFA